MRFKLLLTSLVIAMGVAVLPNASLADSAGAAKCQSAIDKTMIRLAKISSRAGKKACAAGGDVPAILAEMGAVVPRAQKAFNKLVKRHQQIDCPSQDPNFANTTPFTIDAGELGEFYLSSVAFKEASTFKADCDGLATL